MENVLWPVAEPRLHSVTHVCNDAFHEHKELDVHSRDVCHAVERALLVDDVLDLEGDAEKDVVLVVVGEGQELEVENALALLGDVVVRAVETDVRLDHEGPPYARRAHEEAGHAVALADDCLAAEYHCLGRNLGPREFLEHCAEKHCVGEEHEDALHRHDDPRRRALWLGVHLSVADRHRSLHAEAVCVCVGGHVSDARVVSWRYEEVHGAKECKLAHVDGDEDGKQPNPARLQQRVVRRHEVGPQQQRQASARDAQVAGGALH
mmetsp:Transcript_19418/g.74555  ORF Transcript_19418/g.74555 Transcript_19418/m.74555 type:complete len:264 (-) Transcript_19418:189-980(-)